VTEHLTEHGRKLVIFLRCRYVQLIGIQINSIRFEVTEHLTEYDRKLVIFWMCYHV
jgi:hypothetical protein